MPFAAGLREILSVRDCQIASEFHRGDSLQVILDRHLLAVEQMAESELITSILLLSRDGRRLYHGAGPSLPQAYRDAIDGSQIGPSAGSCGTAAFLGQPVYVTDIATDPLWAEYRHLALPHELRSCWSTPIRDADGAIIGTFAIYHRTPGEPSVEELEAIDMIAGHVAQAIVWEREAEQAERRVPLLRLVADNPALPEAPTDPLERLIIKAARLDEIARKLESHALTAPSKEYRSAMVEASENSRELAVIIRRRIESFRTSAH